MATPEVSELVHSLERQFASSDQIVVRYNGKGKDATCNICLRRRDAKLLWIWADGRYQWCWERFRDAEPAIVDIFQKLVHSQNKSSLYFAKPGAVTHNSCDYYIGILSKVCDAVFSDPPMTA